MSRQIGVAPSSNYAATPVCVPALGSAGAAPDRLRALLGMSSPTDVARLPFVGGDATAGAEAELQASVAGGRETVDLPLTIAASGFLANIAGWRRLATPLRGKCMPSSASSTATKTRCGIIAGSASPVPCSVARSQVFADDLRADKSQASGRLRSDADKFVVVARGIEYARVPIAICSSWPWPMPGPACPAAGSHASDG